jgi:predicted DNA-binding transcriptional regulator AlpA
MRIPKEQGSPLELKHPETATAPFNPVSTPAAEQPSPHESQQRVLPQPPAPRAHQRRLHVPATPHMRHGDRGSIDADDASDAARRLPTLVRFTDLKAAGITENWTHLTRLINEQDFPCGILLSANIRAWDVASVRQWLATRPTERKVVNPRRVNEKEVA